MHNAKNVLITGGSGYFGSLLTQKLKEHGYKCHIFDLNDVDDRPDDVGFHCGDIRDYKAVLGACRGMDIIHHNVAQVPLAKNDKLFKSVNYDGTENLLKAALQQKATKVVYTSSSAVFGVPDRNPVTEQTQPRPAESYGQAKLDGEKRCMEYVKKGLDVSIIRPRTIMGHGRLGIFQILFEWIYKGYNVPVFDKGVNIYQFIHADDLAEACILAGEKPGYCVYNCGAERFGTMNEVLTHLCEYSGTKSKVKSVRSGPAVFMMNITSSMGISPLGSYHALMYGKSMYFDINKAKTELAWQPRYSNEDMFVDSYKWYVKNRNKVIAEGRKGSHHRSSVKQGILNLVRYFL